MRRSKGLASAIGVLSFAAACALPAPGRYEMTPSRALDTMSRAQRDSVAAQALADREGPRVTVRTEINAYTSSRRVRAMFHVDDDAYVVIGHIDPDGVLRIVFPTDPHDDGFVQGGRSYSTAQFFAGYADEYAYRLQTVGFYPHISSAHDSYDGGLGYVFVIASWRPFHVDQFSTEGRWDTFELTDQEYMRDPRPAVHELASLLVGDQEEAYTVKFASYFNTLAFYNGNNFFNSEFGVASCPGSNFGFGFTDAVRPVSYYTTFQYYRNQLFGYDSFMGCFMPLGGYVNHFPTVRIAQNPPVPAQPRAFDPNQKHTQPEPRRPGGRIPLSTAPGSDVGNGSHVSTQYRMRGLIADDGPRTPPSRHRPGIGIDGVDGAPASPARPTIQQMVERRANNSHEGSLAGNSGWARAHTAGGSNDGTMRQGMTPAPNPGVSRPGFDPSGTSTGATRGYTSPFESGNANTHTRYTAPASSGVERSAPASHPSAPAPTPVAAPASTSSSPPPASSSSGDGGRPGHPG